MPDTPIFDEVVDLHRRGVLRPGRHRWVDEPATGPVVTGRHGDHDGPLSPRDRARLDPPTIELPVDRHGDHDDRQRRAR